MTKTFPVQPVCIIFTDIVDSTEKWDASQAIMWEAVQTHQVVIRTESHRFGGFECKTLGDGFLRSFSSPRPALHFCLAVQNQLAKTAWHKSIIQAQAAKDRAAGLARRPSRGLVLRIGLHWGLPHQIILDPVVQRKDFYGNIVNVASRIEGEACGDEIAVSDAFLAELHRVQSRGGITAISNFVDGDRVRILEREFSLANFAILSKGVRALKGLAVREHVTLIVLLR
jgi:class 3 adenylate cyclase